MDDFAEECKTRFLHYCHAREIAAYHSLKRKYLAQAEEQLDLFLAWLEIDKLPGTDTQD